MSRYEEIVQGITEELEKEDTTQEELCNVTLMLILKELCDLNDSFHYFQEALQEWKNR